MTLHQNYTQQNCTLFSYLHCKYDPGGGGGGQLPLNGGHHARTWTFKMDPKQVIILRFFTP